MYENKNDFENEFNKVNGVLPEDVSSNNKFTLVK